MKGVRSMKKQYVKPELYFESFELSTSIATCDFKSNAAGNVCAIDLGFGEGNAVYMDKENGCGRQPGPDDIKYCYNPPAAGSTVFSS